ncbi:membrane protein [Bacteroidia bacterium]|nr:membrane protein [Bacteroidia bacterium]
MKNIIKKYSKSLLLVVALSFGSCSSDFLEHQKYGPGDSESFWNTEADLGKALDAFYTYTNSEETTGRGHYWYENCSDNMVTGRTNASPDRMKNFQGGTTESYVHTFWNEMAKVITKANDVLRYVPKMDAVSQPVKDNALGQGYFFRAYGYLWIAPWYGDTRNGGIPIVTELTTVDELDAPRPASVLDNYDMIIDDFRKAGELLPSWSQLTQTEWGRPYKTAAWAFAARAALYAAQFDEAKYYPIVIEMCDKIINLTGADKRELHYLAANHNFSDKAKNSYGLPATNYSDLFRIENNFSEEFIYSIMGGITGGPKFHGMSFDMDGFGGYNNWGYYTPTAELYEAFEPGDTRRDAIIMAPGQRILHPSGTGSLENREVWYLVPANAPERAAEGLTALGSASSSPTHLVNRKMHSIYEVEGGYGTVYNTSGDSPYGRLNCIVMRYADVLLMKAEALIWTKGEGDADAKALLNQIRKRAGLPEDSPATKAALKNERRCELAFEFMPSRHLDLVRWGDAKAIYAQPLHGYAVKWKTVDDNPWVFDPSEKIEVWQARTFDPVKNQVFAIPQSIISKSDGILKQNKDY